MDIRLDQILFQIINFGVVFGAVTYFLYKPVTKMLEERSQKTLEAENAAAEAMAEKASIDALKAKAKLQAEKDAAKMLDMAKSQAGELKKKLEADAKVVVKAEREKAVKSMEQEKKAMQAELERQAASAVVAVTAKVLGKAISKTEHAALISKSLKEIAALG
ncbi:MAG TPA: ATP synthase F0 subunit B [Candidatus Saccharimonadia bacterium]|nr:ATP synthase F0 subunit B [Candidatus Saccharimonadia bacterium]